MIEHVSPATRLLEKRRQMFEVQEALEVQKQEFNRREEVFQRREEGLRKKDLELQESLVKFSKFLQENDTKRTRAEKKAGDEIKLRHQKENEIDTLVSELEVLREERTKTSEIVDKSMRYQKFLETVIEETDEYHEVPDLLMRHKTLEVTNADLGRSQRLGELNSERARQELQVTIKQKTDEILNLNNKISQLKKELESKERDVLALQSGMDYEMAMASQKTLDYGQVCMATDNLFQRCTVRSTIKHPVHTNPITQLNVIGEYMSDLSSIVKSWRANGGRMQQAGTAVQQQTGANGTAAKDG